MEKEYIERGALEKAIDKGHWEYSITMPNKCNFKEIAGAIPAADVVEVVRCKDCIHRNPIGEKCLKDNIWHGLDGFCNFGKRSDK